MLTAAIGDIHGDLIKLNQTISSCTQYADGEKLRFIFLGDYVDRGTDSKGVIDRINDLEQKFETIAIKGNHEMMILEALTNKDSTVRFWMDHGGLATLNSFKIQDIDARLIPEKYLTWIQNRPLFYDDGLRFFVHAGVDMNLPLQNQSENVMLWTRTTPPPGATCDRYIVHGHTVVEVPEMTEATLNIDTGCGFGGLLTTAIFDENQKKPIAFIFRGRLIEVSVFANS